MYRAESSDFLPDFCAANCSFEAACLGSASPVRLALDTGYRAATQVAIDLELAGRRVALRVDFQAAK